MHTHTSALIMLVATSFCPKPAPSYTHTHTDRHMTPANTHISLFIRFVSITPPPRTGATCIPKNSLNASFRVSTKTPL